MPIEITLGRATARNSAGVAQGALSLSQPIASETLSTPGSASTIAASEIELVWTVTAKAEDIYVSFGSAPNGTAPRWFIPNGQTRQFFSSMAGEKIAYATI